MAHQLDSIRPSLTKRSMINQNSILAESPLLRIVKLESLCNQLLCYCQYVNDREDLVLFLDPTNEQARNLSVNDEIRVGGDSR